MQQSQVALTIFKPNAGTVRTITASTEVYAVRRRQGNVVYLELLRYIVLRGARIRVHVQDGKFVCKLSYENYLKLFPAEATQ